MSASRCFTTRHFDRWMRKNTLSDDLLRLAVAEMEQGLIDADLGGGVVKKRVALPGRGKSGGARTLLATNRKNRWIFLFGFAKNERDNIAPFELVPLQEYAEALLSMTEGEITQEVRHHRLREILHAPPTQETEPHPGGVPGRDARPLPRRYH